MFWARAFIHPAAANAYVLLAASEGDGVYPIADSGMRGAAVSTVRQASFCAMSMRSTRRLVPIRDPRVPAALATIKTQATQLTRARRLRP
jgi:hypothetical protein